MPRSSQYSRGRRLVLQGTLVLVLAATLGLAALISQSRERTSAVELTAKPHWAGKLAIRVPKGWQLFQDTDQLPVTVIARESKRRTPGGSRAVEVHQSSSSSATPQEILDRHLKQYEGKKGDAQPFSMLGTSGVLARVFLYEPIPDDPFDRAVEVPAWFAATVLPGEGIGDQDLAVVIGVRGSGMAGPAGERAIAQVADGLSLRAISPPTTLPAEPKDADK